MLTFLSTGAGFLSGAETINPSWQVANVGEGVKPSCDFGPDDSIHVMGMTEQNTGVVWHAKAASVQGPWNPVTLASGYYYGPGGLRVDNNNTAHLSWHNHNQSDPNHASISSEGVINNYRIDTPGNHNGWDSSLAVDSRNYIHMSSVDPNALASLEYSIFDGFGWSYEKVGNSDSFMYGLNTSIVVDANFNPHIIYCNASDWTGSGQLRYAKKNSGTWQITTIIEGQNRGRFPSIEMDSDERLHVAWLDLEESANSGATIQADVKYAVQSGNQWDTETVAQLNQAQVGFSDARKSVSITIDKNNNPHLAYADKQTISYAYKSNGSWTTQTILTSDTDLYKGLAVLRLNSRDQPVIVFWQPVEPAEPGSGLIRILALKETESNSPNWVLY